MKKILRKIGLVMLMVGLMLGALAQGKVCAAPYEPTVNVNGYSNPATPMVRTLKIQITLTSGRYIMEVGMQGGSVVSTTYGSGNKSATVIANIQDPATSSATLYVKIDIFPNSDNGLAYTVVSIPFGVPRSLSYDSNHPTQVYPNPPGNLYSISGHITSNNPTLSLGGFNISIAGTNVSSQSDGSYIQGGLAPGTYTVTASKSGYDSQSRNVTITNSDVGGIGFAFNTYAISGTVYKQFSDGTVKELGNIIVDLYDRDLNRLAETVTDPDGTYDFVNVLPNRQYIVTATLPNLQPHNTIGPYANIHNPVTVANADVNGVEIIFCMDKCCKTIVFVHGKEYGVDAWEGCPGDDNNYEIYKYDGVRNMGLKPLGVFGDDFNSYLLNDIENKVGIDYGCGFTVLGHEEGATVVRAGVIRSVENDLRRPNSNQLLYDGAHIIDVTPFIGGYWEFKFMPEEYFNKKIAVLNSGGTFGGHLLDIVGWSGIQGGVAWDSVILAGGKYVWGHWLPKSLHADIPKLYFLKDFKPDGDIQAWLYGPSGKDKFDLGIGSKGRYDIILAARDNLAPPFPRQLDNPHLPLGLRSDADGAPYVVDDPSWTNSHLQALNSDAVCSRAKCVSPWPQEPTPPPPFIVAKSASPTVNPGEMKLVLFNVGGPATTVLARIAKINRYPIETEYVNFGEMPTVSEKTLYLKFNEPLMPPGESISVGAIFKIHIIANYTGNGVSSFIERDISAGSGGGVSVEFLKNPSSVLLPKVIYFAKKIFNSVLGINTKTCFAQGVQINSEAWLRMILLNSQPALADLNNDGKLEMIVPIAERELRVLKNDGTQLWRYAVSDPGCIALYPAAADINNDGQLEVILSEYGADIIRVFKNDGTLVCFTPNVPAGMPAVADVDNAGDGLMEIVTAKAGRLALISSGGGVIWEKTDLAGYTPATASPVLADLNKDGAKEIIAGDVCVLNKAGTVLSKKTPISERPASVADIDGDGNLEVITGRIFKLNPSNPTDILQEGLTLYSYQAEYPPVIADINGDGKLDVVNFNARGVLCAYYDISASSNKTTVFTFPEFSLRMPLSVLDVDNDGKLEIAMTTTEEFTGKVSLLGFQDSELQLIFDHEFNSMIFSTPVIADLNNDGIVKLIAGDLFSEINNTLTGIDIGSSAVGAIFWPQFQHDALRTGLYDSRIPQLNKIANRTITAVSPSLNITAANAMPEKLSFSAYPMPQGATLVNNGNGTATFNLANSQGGTYPLTFTVTDGVSVISQTATITFIQLPSTPVVTAPATAVRSANFSVSWSSNPRGSAIVEYQYKTLEGSPTGTPITGTSANDYWTSVGTNTSMTVNASTLTFGKTCYFAVRARNSLGWSEIGYSSGTVPTCVLTINSPNGSVAKSVAGSLTTATSFTSVTAVTLAATPSTGYLFGYWSGDIGSIDPNASSITITMDSNKTLTANFFGSSGVPAYSTVFTASNVWQYIAPQVCWSYGNGWIHCYSLNADVYSENFRFLMKEQGFYNITLGWCWFYGNGWIYVNKLSYIALPLAPSNLRASISSKGNLTLNWEDKSNNETGFNLEYSSDGRRFRSYCSLPINATSYPYFSSTPGQQYWFRVYAYNQGGRSADSNTVSVTMPEVTANYPALITSVSPNPVSKGGTVTLYGRYFGASQSDCNLTLAQFSRWESFSISSWSPTKVSFKAPTWSGDFRIVVTTKNTNWAQSNSVNLRVE